MRTKNTSTPINYFWFLCLILALPSCGPGQPGIWKDSKIKANKSDDMHVLNTTLMDNLKSNQYKALQFMLSKELLDDPEMIRTVEHLSNSMKDGSFTLLREYYLVSQPGTKITLSERELGLNNYDIKFNNPTAEMYLAFFVQKGLPNSQIIVAVYNKYDYGWKLSSLDMNAYAIGGKTAPELFDLAVKRYSKGYLVDAVNLMTQSSQCADPYGDWEYVKSQDMATFHGKLLQQANATYKYPYVINAVATHPQLIGVFTQTMPEGQFPVIYYLSKINLKDTVAIKKENAEIRKTIGNVMPGVNTDKKYVFYSAFNQKPNAKTSVAHFDMTDKLQ